MDRQVSGIEEAQRRRRPDYGSDQSALGEAKGFLANLISDGPLPVKQVKKAAQDAGVVWRIVRRAQAARDILSRKCSNEWAWQLPTDPVKVANT
jgi:hypothetical protein